MKTYQDINNFIFFSTVSVVFSLMLPLKMVFAETATDFQATPPLVDLSYSAGKPNILMILDNSNSMDEADTGAAVGSDNAASKSEIARNSLKTMITNFGASSRMGLMAYKQDAINRRKLHDAQYDVSFDPTNYDSSFTGSIASSTKRYRTPNTSSPGTYLYYNVSLPFYSGGNDGTKYCFTNDTTVFPDPGESDRGTSERYNCYDKKSNTSDDTSGFNAADYYGSFYFSPTDSDKAQGIWDFGRFMSWNFVGDAWFANTSPGKGMLHVEIDDVDTSHKTDLFNKLATSQFATATDTPLRNAGLTPLEGTLQSAKNYYLGSLPSSEWVSSGTPSAPVSNSCGTSDYVVLVTDGLPSTTASGADVSSTAVGVAAVAQAAEDLYIEAGVRTYVVGFALPTGVDSTLLDQIAEAGRTDTAYLASDSASLNTALGNIFLNIVNRTSSSTGAAVLANNASGDGAVFQALYSPENEDVNGNKVQWTGALNTLFLDSNGYIREDTNQNGKIDNYLTDMSILYYYDDIKGRTKVRLFQGSSTTTPPDLSGAGASEIELSELKAVWKAQDQLSSLTNVKTQRSYSSVASSGRYILTSLDGESTIDFSEAEVATNNNLKSHLMLGGASATDMVNYIRGEEVAGYRSRTIDMDGDGTVEVQRLGDIVHSTPATVRVPSELYDSKNRDATYGVFREKYKNRRQMVYLGANDGMIHAFNGGFWDDTNKAYSTTNSGETAHPLGAELWAYVPRTSLPHLQWLKDTSYSHIYYVDGEPIIFDANIFSADSDHPYGWGTVLVVGMRLGGGDFEVDTDNDGIVDETLYSSYILLDITNPEVPPTLIAEISDEDMGFTTGVPAVVKKRIPSVTNDFTSTLSVNDWKLIIGSGPTDLSDVTSDQAPGIYVYDLVDKAFDSGYAPNTISSVSNAFVGDIASIDWGGDFEDDIAYFGIVGGTPSSPTGRVMRMRFNTLASSLAPVGISTLINTGRPTFARPHLSTDGSGRAWVHFGTGRMLDSGDNTSTPQQRYYGVFEKSDYSTLLSSDLFDSSNIRVFSNSLVDKNGSTFELPAGTEIETFYALASAIPNNKSGWYRDLEYSGTDPSGRNVTASAQARTVLFFTEYTPGNTTCQPEGASELFAVDYRTGTALPFITFDSDSSITKDSGELSNVSLSLGRGMASAPIVVQSSASAGSVTIITQNSTGQIRGDQAKVGSAVIGRQSWREIEF